MKNGQLMLDFRGDAYACSVSAVVIYPVEKADQGRKFLDSVVEKRRFFFDNYFHRILHKADRRCAGADGRREAARLRRLLARPHAGRLLQRHAAQGGNRPARDRASDSPGSMSRMTVERLPAAGPGQGDGLDQRSDRAGHDSGRSHFDSATFPIG